MLSYVKDPICLHIVFTSYRLVRLCGRYHGTTVIRGQWHDDGDDDDEGVERNGSNGCGLCRPSLRRSLLEICCSQRSKVVEKYMNVIKEIVSLSRMVLAPITKNPLFIYSDCGVLP